MIFEEFINEFKINSGYMNFAIDKYFYNISFFDALFFNLLKTHIIKKYKEKPPITLKHMIEVAKRREWFDPFEGNVDNIYNY